MCVTVHLGLDTKRRGVVGVMFCARLHHVNNFGSTDFGDKLRPMTTLQRLVRAARPNVSTYLPAAGFSILDVVLPAPVAGDAR